jgi:hypothetical protein
MIDPLTSETVVVRSRPSSQCPFRLKQLDLTAALGERRGSRQTGQAAADNGHARLVGSDLNRQNLANSWD